MELVIVSLSGHQHGEKIKVRTNIWVLHPLSHEAHIKQESLQSQINFSTRFLRDGQKERIFFSVLLQMQ